MEIKFAKLIVLIEHLSDKLNGLCKDLEKVSSVLQDPEIVAIIGLNNSNAISKEDYD